MNIKISYKKSDERFPRPGVYVGLDVLDNITPTEDPDNMRLYKVVDLDASSDAVAILEETGSYRTGENIELLCDDLDKSIVDYELSVKHNGMEYNINLSKFDSYLISLGETPFSSYLDSISTYNNMTMTLAKEYSDKINFYISETGLTGVRQSSSGIDMNETDGVLLNDLVKSFENKKKKKTTIDDYIGSDVKNLYQEEKNIIEGIDVYLKDGDHPMFFSSSHKKVLVDCKLILDVIDGDFHFRPMAREFLIASAYYGAQITILATREVKTLIERGIFDIPHHSITSTFNSEEYTECFLSTTINNFNGFIINFMKMFHEDIIDILTYGDFDGDFDKVMEMLTHFYVSLNGFSKHRHRLIAEYVINLNTI